MLFTRYRIICCVLRSQEYSHLASHPVQLGAPYFSVFFVRSVAVVVVVPFNIAVSALNYEAVFMVKRNVNHLSASNKCPANTENKKKIVETFTAFILQEKASHERKCPWL